MHRTSLLSRFDYTPKFPVERSEWLGKAYANGYIRALIKTVYG